MAETSVNPIFIFFLFILRCLVPVGLLLGVSYLLRRLGLVAEAPKPPKDWNGGGQGGQKQSELHGEDNENNNARVAGDEPRRSGA